MRFARFALLAALGAAPAFAEAGRERVRPATRPARASFSPERRFPARVRFEPNLGQWDPAIRFLGRAATFQVMLADGEAVFRCGGPGTQPDRGIRVDNRTRTPSEPGGDLRVEFVGASPSSPVAPSGMQPSVSHYFHGNLPERWRSGVPHFDAASYRGLWKGIDLVFRGDGPEMEYDLVVAPGADLDAARFRWSAPVDLDADGNLLVRMPRGEVRQSAPRLFQETRSGRREVAGAFRILADGSVGFEAGAYDRSLPLVVDPKVVYCSYLGGSQQDIPHAVALDPGGNILVTGQTDSTDFPVPNAYQGTFVGATTGTIVDGFLAKLTPDGSALIFATYYGGDGLEDPKSVAADPSGNIVVVGNAVSTNLPAINAFQANNAGGAYDMFIVKFASDGASIVFSTYLGTSGQDEARDVACDSTGIYITGLTSSPAFPTLQGVQNVYGGGVLDAVLVKFQPSGANFIYSTFYGGSLQDNALTMAIDSAGAVYIAGGTNSTDFPTKNPIQGAYAGGGTTSAFPNDDFLVKIAPGGGSVVYATYLGGSDFEDCQQMAVTPSGEACLTGTTASGNFPTKPGLQAGFGGGTVDAWCAKVNAQGTALAWSTFLGGTGDDIAFGIDSDASGNVTLCGVTNSTDLQTTLNAFQRFYTGGGNPANDAFVTKINSAGTKILYETYMGGGSFDDATSLALDGNGDPVIVGVTGGPSLTLVNPQQAFYGGGTREGYIVRLALAPPKPPSILVAALQGTGAIQLTWVDQASTELGFEIERKSGTDPFSLLTTVNADVQIYQDFSLAPATTYTYRVRAVNGDGGSAYTNEASAATNATIPPPISPNNLQVTVVATTRNALTWNDRSSNEFLFEVERRVIPGTFQTATSVPTDTTAWDDTAIGPDTSVRYRVRAVGVTSASAYSNEVTALTPPTLGLTKVKGSLVDSASAARDKAKAKGSFAFLPASADGTMDPVAQGVSVFVGGEEFPAVVTIGPGDPGWKVSRTKATWKTPRESNTKATVVIDTGKHTFSVSLSKITFPGAVGNPVRLSLRVGNDAGSVRATWVNKKPGVFSYKQP